jgi:hypothetical protein
MNPLSWLASTAYAQSLPALNFQSGSVTDTSAGTGLSTLINHILDLLIAAAWPLAFIGIVYSAYILITSAGKVEAYAAVKKNVTFILTGILVIVLGLYGVRFIITLFGNH